MSVQVEIEDRVDVPDLLAVSEAAALLRVGLTFADASTARFIATGSNKEIPAIKVGRLTRVPRLAFERFLDAPITWPIPKRRVRRSDYESGTCSCVGSEHEPI